MDVEKRLQEAVQSFWTGRSSQADKQKEAGKIDAGSRGEITGGQHMGELETLIVDILINAGLTDFDIKVKSKLELPGYYRAEKKWDVLVISKGHLVAAIEFKSQAGDAIGNNLNNRAEEVVGLASDLWVAFREGLFHDSRPPFLGYFFLLQDFSGVRKPVRCKEPYFPIDPIFKGLSYADRYAVLCQRLMLERLYNAVCLTLATRPDMNQPQTVISHPTPDVSFKRFVATLEGHIYTFLNSPA
ncbi:MAG TPA: PaeR7I family type II restriction endonuclease [Pyrinomonadaceae bacterium]|nr:PaeR7I family type II restriction endonuclease [Pyrinomonadaceae bacterium]